MGRYADHRKRVRICAVQLDENGVLCMLTPQEKSIYAAAHHWRYEDNLSWKFVTGMVNQDLGTDYTTEKLSAFAKNQSK